MKENELSRSPQAVRPQHQLAQNSDQKQNDHEPNSSHSKRELREFLRAAARIKPLGTWSLARKAAINFKSEDAGSALPLTPTQWTEFKDQLSQAQSLGIFAAQPEWNEPSEMELTLTKILGGKHPPFAYPRATGTNGEMEFAVCSLAQTVAEKNQRWRSAPAKAPASLPDFVFVPGLLMDSLGNRLGHGQGFFDRYLQKHPKARRIGTIHSRFVVEELSNNWIEKHDQTMEILWTERGIYQTPNSALIHKEHKS